MVGMVTTQSNSVLFYTLQTWKSFNCQRKLDYPKKPHALIMSAHIQTPEGKVQIRNALAGKYQLATIVPKWAKASFVLLHRAAHTVPEVFINSFEASLLSGQCSSSKNGLQINPAPLNGIQTEQILIQVGQTNFPQTDLDIRGVNTQTFVTVSSSGFKC